MQRCIWIAIVRFQGILTFLQVFLDPCSHKRIPYPIFFFNLPERHMFIQMQTNILHFLIFAILSMACSFFAHNPTSFSLYSTTKK